MHPSRRRGSRPLARRSRCARPSASSSAEVRPSPSRAEQRVGAGTRTSVNARSTVLLVWMPSFSVTFSTSTPGVAASTKNAEMPLAPAPPVRNIAIIDAGETAVGAPLLAAIEHVSVAVTPGAAADRRRVGAGIRLGQSKAGDAIARTELGQPHFFLRNIPQPRDRRADHRVDRDRHRRPGIDSGYLFDRRAHSSRSRPRSRRTLRARACPSVRRQ